MNYSYREKLFPVSRFFIKLMIIILALFLVVFLCTRKETSKNNNSNYHKNDAKTLSDNLQAIKEEALKYFTEENIQDIIDSNKKITLKEINKKLVIKDSNNKMCNSTSSYVTLRKTSTTSYEMKIFLKCNKDKDYILVKLEDNGTCSTFLCEKDNNKKQNKETLIENENTSEDDDVESTKKTSQSISQAKKTTKKRRITTYKGSIEIVDTTNREYIYQYVKENSILYSSWSPWVNSGIISCSANNINCEGDSICLKEEKIEKQNNKQSLNLNKISIKKVGSNLLKVCQGYDYISFNNTLYRVSSDYSNLSNWDYISTEKYFYPPKDTLNTKYIYNNTLNNRSGNREIYFDKYVYNGITYNSYCGNGYISKMVDSYSYQAENITVSQNEEICTKMTRTRNILNSYSYVWSSYDNKYLLNNGYKYSGKKELKK